MSQGAVKIPDHALRPLVFRILLQHGLIAFPHAERHLTLTHVTSGHRTVSRKEGRHPVQDLIKIFPGTAESGRTEEKYLPAGQGAQKLFHFGAAASLVRPESCVYCFHAVQPAGQVF